MMKEELFYLPRVKAILEMIQIGDIMPNEIEMVYNLLCKFTDIFARLVKEVKPASHMKY